MSSSGWGSVLGSIVLTASVVACGSSASGSSGGAGGGTSSSSSGDPGFSVECAGTPFDAERYFEIGSCQLQGGEWIAYDGNGGSHCRPSTLPCSYYGYSDGTVDARKRCLEVIGCGVVERNGTITKNADDGGRCTGTATPCEQISADKCPVGWGCDSPNGADCRRDEGLSEPHACEDVNQADDGSRWHPTKSREMCEQRLGCVWKPKS